MSIPVQGEADQEPAQNDPLHEAETDRLQNDVVEAAQRLEREARERAALTEFQLQPNNTVSFRIAVARRPVEAPGREDANERVWSALKSEFLAPPPQKGWGVPGIAMIAGCIGAVVVSAAVALLVVNMVNLSSPGALASGDDDAARNQSFSAAAANLTRVASAQAKMAEEPPTPTALLTAAIPTSEASATAQPSPVPLPSASPEMQLSPSPEIKPAAAETAAPPPAAPPPAPAAAAPAAPEPQPTIALTPDEIAPLLKRGRDLIATGDVASARLVLTHLADAGVAEASFVLAGTFDPTVLENLRVVGVKPDPAKAKLWYSRAAEQGSLEAKQRLQALR
jgi:hypothetical protein